MSIIIKTKKMKKIFIVTLLILINISCKAQIVPIEKLIDYIKQNQGVPEGTSYIKDINNLRDKFVGVWKGTYENNIYEIQIVKQIDHFLIDEDVISMRYKITNLNGTVLEDTRLLPNDNPYVTYSRYFEKSWFVLTYEGRESKCGQRGELFVEPLETTNYKTMELFLVPSQDFLIETDCPNGAAKQLFPKTQMLLTKQ